MSLPALAATARSIVANGKGLLAMDESTATCNLRFARIGIPQSLAMRQAYRELLVTAPRLAEYINGVILVDETIRQAQSNGTALVETARRAGILIGIKVDMGAKDLAAHPGEKVTEGLDGLRHRLQAYHDLGARFAKWRGVISVDKARLPSAACVEVNAHALARYAVLSQEAGLVPIIEPEVLMDGDHTLARCQQVTEVVLRCVFKELALQGVVLEAIILKPNMVLAGVACKVQHTAEQVAGATLECLRRAVPPAVPGIAFLSGGQSGELATARLNAMHVRPYAAEPAADKASESRCLPWTLSFSFARALQHPAMEIWAGKDANRGAAQAALTHRARCNFAALKGEYGAAMEAP